MHDDIAATIARYAEGADRLIAALDGLSDEALRARPTADEWSIAEVLAHLADAETIAGERYRRIIADPEAILHPLFQVAWATQLHYDRRDPRIAAATFRAMRAANTEILRLIPPDAWERTGRHLLTGPVTLRAQVEEFAAHAEEHVEQIVRARGA